jgi:uncharacterized protein (DUF2461 family)
MLGHIITHEAAAWFAACEADNSRDFWARERASYDRHVKAPLLELLRASGEDVAHWRVYRPHRDTRFSPTAAPLKTFLGALQVQRDGTGRYLQVDRRGLLASSGLPYLAPDQLPRWRQAVDGDRGQVLDDALSTARGAGLRIKSGYPEPLKRVPRGHDPQHPRADLLRWKGIEAYARLPLEPADQPSWLSGTWDGGRAVCTWLALHVGATALERSR